MIAECEGLRRPDPDGAQPGDYYPPAAWDNRNYLKKDQTIKLEVTLTSFNLISFDLNLIQVNMSQANMQTCKLSSTGASDHNHNHNKKNHLIFPWFMLG